MRDRKAYSAEYREVLSKLTLMSDIFMRSVLKNPKCTEHILRLILDEPGLQVTEQILQKDYKNLQGRSVVPDCVAVNEVGKLYNLEFQQESEGASPRRARYHGSMMDMDALRPGEPFQKLPESWVIFITQKDVLGQGGSVYHVERRVRETGKEFDDGTHIIYVNASYRADTELGHLMHDLNCADPDDMYSDVLAERVRELKETPEEVESMCELMDELYRKGEKCGMKRGKHIGRLEQAQSTAIRLAGRGATVEDIAEVLDVGRRDVESWLRDAVCLVE